MALRCLRLWSWTVEFRHGLTPFSATGCPTLLCLRPNRQTEYYQIGGSAPGSDSYVERPDRQEVSHGFLSLRRTVRSYVRPFDADLPLAMMNSAASASLINFARSSAR